MSEEILKVAEDYVKDFFEKQNTEAMHFHNIDHTENVVEAVDLIAERCEMDPHEKTLIKLAAWFHDTGYFFKREGHEDSSIKIATQFLKSQQIPEEDISIIEQCIESTKKEAIPKSKYEMVMKDADLYHLSTDIFLEKSLSLRKEWKAVSDEKLNKEKYLFDTLEFMAAHRYYSRYGIEVLTPRKQKNIEKVKQEISELVFKKADKKISKLEKELAKTGGTARGIETMFRATARNQINLSAIADNKSNILISVNAIILSVMITYVVRDVNSITNMIYPLIAMVITNLLTIIFAVLATLPHLSPGKFHERDVKDKRANLLFFGNFHNMDYEKNEWGVKSMMRDFDYLYGTMIRDQYELGLILNMKFKKLRIAYFIFMFGLIFTFLMFIFFTI
ncbi:MAG TPA: Pycsar system effector family protein [Bacteroidales bacterium]|nr:Pycsar system effector family protein [Bacteroidales bacterium]